MGYTYSRYWIKYSSDEKLFSGGAPISICHFFRPSICLSVAHHISGTVLHMIMIFGTLVWNDHIFICFFSFWFFVLLGGKKWSKMKNNYIRHVSYLRNSIAYGHDFWYTVVKLWYFQGFSSFLILIFWAVRWVKGQKIAQNDKKLFSLPFISGAIHHMIFIYGTHV